METKETSSAVHHGKNVKYARQMRGKTQGELGSPLDMVQYEVANLETKKKIDKEILEIVSKFLNVDMKFLEEFVPDDVLTTSVNNGDLNDSSTTKTTND